MKDSQFSKDSTEQWHYTSPTNGITIPFEFLAAGGGFVSASKSPQPTSLGGFIPSLEELAVMTSITAQSQTISAILNSSYARCQTKGSGLRTWMRKTKRFYMK